MGQDQSKSDLVSSEETKTNDTWDIPNTTAQESGFAGNSEVVASKPESKPSTSISRPTSSLSETEAGPVTRKRRKLHESNFHEETLPLHAWIIRRNLTSLIERMDTEHTCIYDKLLEKGVFSRLECQQIKKSSLVNWEQTSTMLSKLESKSSEDFNRFVEALKETGQGFLVPQLLGGADVQKWRRSLAQHYDRSLDNIPVYPLTDNPTMAKLRQIYTRTDLCLAPGWPPAEAHSLFMDYSDMFTSGCNMNKRILLLGSPGNGKSMLGHMMALNWADQTKPETKDSPNKKDSDSTKQEKTLLDKFSLLLYINLSRINPNCYNLSTVISEQIVMESPEDIPYIIDYIGENQDKCCVILDGWDEYDPAFSPEVTNIANGRLWPNAFVTVMSRIREQTVLPENMDSQCMVKGFNKSQAAKYVDKILEAYGYAGKKEKLLSFIEDHNLWEIFSVPLMLNFLCTLYMSDIELQDKVTLLFTNIIQSTIGKQKLKSMKAYSSSRANVPLETYRKELMALGELALLGLTGNTTKTTFTKEQVMDIVGESGLNLGLLQMIKSQDPTGSIYYRFPHKSIQEYIAAIYVCNLETAFNGLLEYLDSLIKIYDSQLFVLFISGMNPAYGETLIEGIQGVAAFSTATAAECPAFSWSGWQTDEMDPADIAWRHTYTANDISPFVIKCCWESPTKVHCHSFPFSKPPKEKTCIKISPTINFKILYLSNIIELVRLNELSLNQGYNLGCYNLNVSQANVDQVSKLFQHLAQNIKTQNVNILNVTCILKSKIVYDLIKHFHHLQCFTMFKVKLCKSDLEFVMRHLTTQKYLDKLWMKAVSFIGCEAILCSTVKRLSSLKRLYLLSLDLPSFEDRLCRAISHLHQLQLLNLYKTDLSGAGEAFSNCIKTLCKLKYLNLYKCKLMEEQIRQVVLVLPSSCPGLLCLSLRQLRVHSTVTELQKGLPQLKQLKAIDVRGGGLNTQQQIDIISSLPPSTLVIIGSNRDTSDGIISLVKQLPSLPLLQYLWLDMSSVSAFVTQKLREACQEHNVGLIGNDDDYKIYGPGVAQISSDIQDECR